jgi:hypothetical protein
VGGHADQREAERAERERLREEAKARREYEQEQQRLTKELNHYRNALAAVGHSGDSASGEELQAKVAEIERALEGVQARAANIRAGYVYVISNPGAFGEHMVKIGLTRRLDLRDRIYELGCRLHDLLRILTHFTPLIRPAVADWSLAQKEVLPRLPMEVCQRGTCQPVACGGHPRPAEPPGGTVPDRISRIHGYGVDA